MLLKFEPDYSSEEEEEAKQENYYSSTDIETDDEHASETEEGHVSEKVHLEPMNLQISKLAKTLALNPDHDSGEIWLQLL